MTARPDPRRQTDAPTNPHYWLGYDNAVRELKHTMVAMAVVIIFLLGVADVLLLVNR
jgi:hypothetical protein